MMRRTVSTICLAAVAVAVGMIPTFAAPAVDTTIPTATYNDPCVTGLYANSLCRTDDRAVSFYMDSGGEFELEPVDRTAVTTVMARYRDQTVFTLSYDSSPVFSGSAQTDVIWQEGAFGMPDNVRGITWCNDKVAGSAHQCDQAYIRIRGAGTYNQKIAGHEAGHAFGQTHGAQAAPVRAQCASVMGIMRAELSCLDSAALGDLIIANINWSF